MKRTIIAAVLLLTGCASVSDVTPLGAERYMVGSRVRGGMTSWEEVKAMAVKRGNEYCAAKGMHAEVEDMQTHGARGWTPQDADVIFRCVN